ncbi:MAG: PIG-L family deacetylase [Deinococcus sp.]|nr:PIG-L family deacetylase [Deinococcus sp.]
MAGQLTILGIGAHPDDLEILCGGTLARYTQAGQKVVMAHLCTGDKGHYVIPPRELVPMRDAEARAAAALIGAESVSLGVPDIELHPDQKTRELVAEFIRQVRPQLIITHDPGDYLVDHITASQLAIDGSFMATLPQFKSVHPFLEKLPAVYFMDTLLGVNFQPTEYVDISDTFPLKREMMRQHQSQLKWLLDHDNTDFLAELETMARFRGLQCGVRYAEAFRPYHVWGRVRPARLLP